MSNLIRLIEMFDKAAKAIKYPSIRNLHINGRVLTLHRTGLKSRYPGSISINTAEKIWLGNIDRSGKFWKAQGCPEWVLGFLEDLAANPEAIAAQHGKSTGQCCFCSRLLTDDRDGYSVDVGYGPVCAKRYGLKWGEPKEPKEPKAKKPTKKAYKEAIKSGENLLNLSFDAWASVQIMGF